TPLMVRWPDVTDAGAVDSQHMVSSVDLVPTLLEIIGDDHPTPDRLHGRSFVDLLRGETQENRQSVFVQYYENSGRKRHPMRGVHTRRYLYLFNPWSNGEDRFATATTGTATYREMKKLAATDPKIAARLQLFDHRVPAELYDIQSDPDCLNNLIDNPAHADDRTRLEGMLGRLLGETGDPIASVFQQRSDADALAAFMKKDRAVPPQRAKRKKPKKAPRTRNRSAG
ncbi:MAG: sulfatase/phosphatase domain-containing protein, partial [Planctomycetota bacterium]